MTNPKTPTPATRPPDVSSAATDLGEVQKTTGGLMTDKQIAEFRELRDEGMISAVGEYTPRAFWDALDEIERLRMAESILADDIMTRDMRIHGDEGYVDQIEWLRDKIGKMAAMIRGLNTIACAADGPLSKGGGGADFKKLARQTVEDSQEILEALETDD